MEVFGLYVFPVLVGIGLAVWIGRSRKVGEPRVVNELREVRNGKLPGNMTVSYTYSKPAFRGLEPEEIIAGAMILDDIISSGGDDSWSCGGD